jgi:rhamnogalacturonyl hydrolase YesR
MLRAVLLASAATLGGATSTPEADSLGNSLLPSPAAILADGKRAFSHWAQVDPLANCGWTGSTFLVGVMEYYKASATAGAADPAALAYAKNWSEAYDYQICGGAAAAAAAVEEPPSQQQPTSAAPTTTCATAEGISFDRGANLNSSRVSSVGDCCALCQKNPKCKAFNMIGSTCYLHPEIGKIVAEAGDISGVPHGKLPPLPPPAPPKPHHNEQHVADNQLCGATYVELYKLDGKQNKTMLASTAAILGAEIADPSTDSLWSWVDALHMAMSTYSRMGNATGEQRYFGKQFADFNTSVLASANGGAKGSPGSTYGFWNVSDHLFYRDDRFLGTQVYWGRGNGWAIAALVSAMEFGPQGVDPHYGTYRDIFLKHAAKLKTTQFSDGAWRSSMLNVTAGGGACSWGKTPRDMCNPVAETTGTANFCYGLAWGINAGLLPSTEYAPVVAKAWEWLSTTALHEDGLVGNCQVLMRSCS